MNREKSETQVCVNPHHYEMASMAKSAKYSIYFNKMVECEFSCDHASLVFKSG